MLKLITPPAFEPVSLIEAKTHLRVDYEDQNAEISSLITAARVYCEQYQHRAYAPNPGSYGLIDSPMAGRPTLRICSTLTRP